MTNDRFRQAITHPWERTCPSLVVKEISSTKVSGSELPWQPARRGFCHSQLTVSGKSFICYIRWPKLAKGLLWNSFLLLSAEFNALYDHHQHRLIFPEYNILPVVTISLHLIAEKATTIVICTYMTALVDAKFTSYLIPYPFCILWCTIYCSHIYIPCYIILNNVI